MMEENLKFEKAHGRHRSVKLGYVTWMIDTAFSLFHSVKLIESFLQSLTCVANNLQNETDEKKKKKKKNISNNSFGDQLLAEWQYTTKKYTHFFTYLWVSIGSRSQSKHMNYTFLYIFLILNMQREREREDELKAKALGAVRGLS